MELALIDAIGPFSRIYKRKINWSKIPRPPCHGWPGTETQGARSAPISKSLSGKAVGLGYNAVSLDDVAHLLITLVRTGILDAQRCVS
jgi:hypothetical protein